MEHHNLPFFHFDDIHRNNDDGRYTFSSTDQKRIEDDCQRLFHNFNKDWLQVDPEAPYVNREATASYLRKGLISLSASYVVADTGAAVDAPKTEPPLTDTIEQTSTADVNMEMNDSCDDMPPSASVAAISGNSSNENSQHGPVQGLDASRPWFAFWLLHSLELLGEPLSEEINVKIISFLKTCISSKGGYGGGPGQEPHLATTYAAVMSLCIIGSTSAFESIDRTSVLKFIRSVHQKDGSFNVCRGGESDIRGTYCALAVVTLLNLAPVDTFVLAGEWVAACQTYEGGYGAEPGCEAHGGYAFCGIASLLLLGREALCDTQALLRWASFRHMKFEGGFQGRTNKLVDGCYSFWVGAVFPMVQEALHKMQRSRRGSGTVEEEEIMQQNNDGVSATDKLICTMFDQKALQAYILLCCQQQNGGLCDKPGKSRDFYHTCYTLSGLSVAQHCSFGKSDPVVVGSKLNVLVENHPVYNICVEKERNAKKYFRSLSKIEL